MIIAVALAVYMSLGMLFAIAFVVRGIDRVDAAARSSKLGFRLIVIPGAAALWPVLLRKWMSARV